jgi:hypothetical protein
MPLHTRYIGKNYQTVTGIDQSGNGVILDLLKTYGKKALVSNTARKFGKELYNKGFAKIGHKISNPIIRSIVGKLGNTIVDKGLNTAGEALSVKKTKKKKKKVVIRKKKSGVFRKRPSTRNRRGGAIFRRRRPIVRKQRRNKKSGKCYRKRNIFDLK